MELGHIKLQIGNICSNGGTDTDGKSMPDFDENVIGIITLEDVMEELLQVRFVFQIIQRCLIFNANETQILCLKTNIGLYHFRTYRNYKICSTLTKPHNLRDSWITISSSIFSF